MTPASFPASYAASLLLGTVIGAVLTPTRETLDAQPLANFAGSDQTFTNLESGGAAGLVRDDHDATLAMQPGSNPVAAVLIQQEVVSDETTVHQRMDVDGNLEGPRQAQPGPLPRMPQKVLAFISAYCPGPCEVCETTGRTKTGHRCRSSDRGCATAWKAIPPGSRVTVPGMGSYVVDDRGGDMVKSWKRGVYHVDLRLRSHREAVAFGTRWATVTAEVHHAR